MPNSKFYVLLYPKENNGCGLYDKLKKYLEDNGISYLDYPELFAPKDPRYILRAEDRHPSPLANKVLAEAIVNDLGLE